MCECDMGVRGYLEPCKKQSHLVNSIDKRFVLIFMCEEKRRREREGGW